MIRCSEHDYSHCQWLYDLVQALQAHYNQAAPIDTTLIPSSFGIVHGKPGSNSYTVKAIKHGKPTVLRTKELILCDVYACLRCWLGFPGGSSHLQGIFVRTLQSIFDSNDALILEHVWQAYTKLKSSIIGAPVSSKAQSVSPAGLTPFFNALRKHPVADPESDAGRALADISLCYAEVSGLWHALSRGLPIPRSMLSGPDDGVADDAMDVDNHTLPSQLQQIHGRLDSLLKFVRELYPLLDPSFSAETDMQKHVTRDRDYYLPFCQHAPLAQRLRSEDGPLHPTHAGESGAWPSAILFRACLYRSTFAYDGDTLFFRSYSEWEHIHTQAITDGQPVRYFVHHQPYGTTDNRNLNHVHEYFQAEEAWNAKKAEDPAGLSFLKCFRFLSSRTKPTENMPSKKLLVHCGPLTAMLAAGDLVYAGLVKAPSVTEMADVIQHVGKGAVSAMKQMGMLSGSSISTVEVREVFGEVYNFLDSQLTDNEKLEMTFDAIMVEHLLCKFQRCLQTFPDY